MGVPGTLGSYVDSPSYFPLVAKNLKSRLEGQLGESLDARLGAVLRQDEWYLVANQEMTGQHDQSELLGIILPALGELPSHDYLAVGSQSLQRLLADPLEKVGQQVFHLLRLEIITKISLDLILWGMAPQLSVPVQSPAQRVLSKQEVVLLHRHHVEELRRPQAHPPHYHLLSRRVAPRRHQESLCADLRVAHPHFLLFNLQADDAEIVAPVLEHPVVVLPKNCLVDRVCLGRSC